MNRRSHCTLVLLQWNEVLRYLMYMAIFIFLTFMVLCRKGWWLFHNLFLCESCAHPTDECSFVACREVVKNCILSCT